MEEAVIQYVSNGTEEEKREILRYPNDPAWKVVGNQGMTVYRGQTATDGSPSVFPLFSASTKKEVARGEFAGEGGCVWTITLQPGVKYIDIAEYLGKKYKKPYEFEILVVGKGSMDFKQTSKSPCEYSATYSATPPPARPSKTPVTLETLRTRVTQEELDTFGEPTEQDLLTYIYPNEVLVKGGKKKKVTRRAKRRHGKKSRGGLKRVNK